jgi:TonB family protein
MRLTIGALALAWPMIASAGDSGVTNEELVTASGGWDKGTQTTELLGSKTLSSVDTSGKAVTDHEAIQVELFSNTDPTTEALHAYQQKVSLVVGRKLDRSKDGAVKVKVDANGAIEYTAITKHSGDKRFDKAMVRAVKDADTVPPPPSDIQHLTSQGIVLDL